MEKKRIQDGRELAGRRLEGPRAARSDVSLSHRACRGAMGEGGQGTRGKADSDGDGWGPLTEGVCKHMQEEE